MEAIGSAAVATPFILPLAWIIALGGVILVSGGALYLLAGAQGLAEHRIGLILGLRGLVAKELRSRGRGWRPVALLTAYLGALALAVAGFLALTGQSGGTIQPTTGLTLFSTLSTGAVLLLALITPALTTGAISGERERRTFDLLLVTRASALGLVAGKLLGALAYILFLLAAALPAFAVVYLFGGVPPLYLGMTLAVAAVTAVSFAALGLLLSAIFRRTLLATVVAYLIVFILTFGLPVVGTLSGLGRSPGVPPWYANLSPLTALGSVLPNGASGPIVGGTAPAAVPPTGVYPTSVYYSKTGVGPLTPTESGSLTRTVYVLGVDPVTGQTRMVTTWAPWVYHFLLSGVLALLCLLWAALAVAPVKPWQAVRLRWRRRPGPQEVLPA